jgi:hypothetical protein
MTTLPSFPSVVSRLPSASKRASAKSSKMLPRAPPQKTPRTSVDPAATIFPSARIATADAHSELPSVFLSGSAPKFARAVPPSPKEVSTRPSVVYRATANVAGVSRAYAGTGTGTGDLAVLLHCERTGADDRAYDASRSEARIEVATGGVTKGMLVTCADGRDSSRGMARASEVRACSGPCARTVCSQGFRSRERT